MRILLLGGTTEARELSTRLAPHDVVSSLAGRVREPVLPGGEVRVGGFGGAEGLASWLVTERIDAVVDATHPFAVTITANAQAACRSVGLPSVVLRRPPWPIRDEYVVVPDVHEAVVWLAEHGPRRAFLTIGRQDVPAFARLDDWFLIRAIDPPSVLPGRHQVLLERGPFAVQDEVDLLRRHEIDVLVTKNSGGTSTSAKLVAARARGVQVLMIERPALPDSASVVESVDAAVDWVSARLGQIQSG